MSTKGLPSQLIDVAASAGRGCRRGAARTVADQSAVTVERRHFANRWWRFGPFTSLSTVTCIRWGGRSTDRPRMQNPVDKRSLITIAIRVEYGADPPS